VIANDKVQAPEDLNSSENKEIDQLVDIAMREDSSLSPAANQIGYPPPPQYQYGGNGFVPQGMYYYYYVFPIAPPPQPHHQHHLFQH
jgi:hypothetical protein